MVTIATRFAIGLTTSTPPSRSNLRRYHRHQGRYCRIANTTKTDPARARELYYIAQLGRAVRIASELMMHGREGSIEEAVRYMVEHTPWMDEHVAWFDCEVYLRRPTYGIGYTIGAVQIQQLFSDRARQLGDAFDLREFHDAILGAGRIPISMTRWEMTGLDDEGNRFFDDSGGQ